MDIKKCKYRLRCEMGACGKRAEYTIQPARVGIRSSVHICSDCLDAIIKEGGKLLQTAKAAEGRGAPEAAVKAKGKGKGKAAVSGGAAVMTAEAETAAEVIREA